MGTSYHSLRASSLYVVFSLLAGLFATIHAPLPANASINYLDSTCDLTQVNGVYEISTAEQLWEIAGCSDESAVFSLSGSIDVSGSIAPTTSPIGWAGACDNDVQQSTFVDGRKRFSGTFEGNGHTISNFAISVNSSCPAGLFAVLKNATIKNLNLVGTAQNIRSSGAYDGAAGLAGTAFGDVTLSHFVSSVVITARKGATGGFIASNVGRELGVNARELPLRLHVEASQNKGAITVVGSGQAQGIGGLVGVIGPSNPATSLTVNQFQNIGPISSTGSGERIYVGGVVGYLDGFLNLNESTNLAAVNGSSYVGGLVGQSNGTATISDAINAGSISATATGNNTGGLIGYQNGLIDVRSSRNIGNINSAGIYVGGLIGYLESALALVSSSGNAGVITASQRVGGLIGYGDYSNGKLTVFESSNSGQVSAMLDNAGGASSRLGTGGLIGYFGDGLVEVYGSSNHASMSGLTQVGGLVGQSRDSQATISNSSNHAAISGSDDVGGLVGNARGGLVEVYGSTNHASVFGLTNVGGLVGRSSGNQATISNSSNHAAISGSDDVGGLVGSGVDTTLAIIQSSNIAPVEASAQGSVGGIFGSGDEDTSISIRQSFNAGDISGSFPGGMFGFLDGSIYHLSDTYNVGRVTGANASGFGWQGGRNASQLQRVYSAGRFGSAPSDGLIAGYPTDTVVSSSFTSTASTLVSASSEAELKVITTFVGWDFDTVWGFGPCNLNDGFPVLRWAHPGETFYSYSCGENSQPVQNNQVPGSSVAPPPTAPVYMGPILDGGMISVSRLEQVEIAGSRLLSIAAAEIDGFVVEILSLSSSSMIIKIPPSVSDGVHDFVVLSSYGTLTVQRKLQIIQPLAPESFGELLGYRFSLKFQGNSRSLSSLQEAGVDRSLGEFSEATTIVCWGYTTSVNPKDWAIAHATARANSVCAQAQTVRGDVKYYVRVRFGVPKDAAMRASMQFWTSEKSN